MGGIQPPGIGDEEHTDGVPPAPRRAGSRPLPWQAILHARRWNALPVIRLSSRRGMRTQWDGQAKGAYHKEALRMKTTEFRNARPW